MSPLKALYAEIWNERKHRCEVCGDPIREPVVHNFAHIYSRGAHPALKFVKLNIQLWCSTLTRRDKQIGCHESSHSSNPGAFRKRALEHNWVKPSIQEIKEKEHA